MYESRREVLEMLSVGQITADQADRLIAAMENEPRSASSGNESPSLPKPKPKYLRVLVDADNGTTKVNVRVPMQLLRAGVKLASLIPAQAQHHVNDAMREHGIPFDLSQVKPENLEEIID